MESLTVLQREQIVDAYRLLLGRAPESEAVIEHLCQTSTIDKLARTLLASAEFRRRAALGFLPLGEQRWVCAEIRLGLRLWLDLLDAGVGAGALQDNWEPNETTFVLSQLSAGDTFIDVGANIGWYTILAAERVGPNGRVHAFEPRADLFARLTDSVCANGFEQRCVLHQMALGDTSGVMQIAHVPTERNPGHSFLLPATAETADYVDLGTVPVERLDTLELESKPRLIKVDTEGAEFLVLRGAAKILNTHRPTIVTEFFPTWLRRVSKIEPEDYLRFLWDMGYRLFHLTAEGATKEITSVPAEPEDYSTEFYLNIVAASEPKPVQVILPETPSANFGRGWKVLDDDVPRLRDKFRRALEQRDRWQFRVLKLEAQVAEHSAQVSNLEAHVAERSAQVSNLEAQLQHAEGAIQQADDKRLQTTEELRLIQYKLAEAESQLHALMTSTTFRMTEPMRRFATLLPPGVRIQFRRALRVLWWTASGQLPQRLKGRKAVVTKSPTSLRPRATSPNDYPLELNDLSGPIAVIIDDRWPEPDRDSGSLDAVNMITSLVAFGYHTIMAKCGSHHQEQCYRDLVRAYGGVPLSAEGPAAVQAFIEHHAEQFSLFILSRVGAGGQFLELIRYNAPAAKIVFNTVDLHFLRESRAARLGGDTEALRLAEQTRDREEFLAGKADATVVVSDVEQEILVNSVPGAKVMVLPLARTVRRPEVPFEHRTGIGFVGGFAHQPNIDAVHHFLSDIWPHIATVPGMRFEIAGSGLPLELLQGIPGDVRYLGHVEDLDAWLDNLRLTVAPLRIGAGAKGKVASSLSAGLPCVASPIAAEGMGLTRDENILVGETPDDFAHQVLTLYSDADLWQRLSIGGFRFAEEVLSVAAYRKRLRRLLIELQLPAFAETRPRGQT